jgi:hypothetical protein
MAVQKPKLLFQAVVERRPFFRRFAWWMLGAVAAAGAGIALTIAAQRKLANANVLQVGQLVAIALVALAVIRALVNLVKGLRRRNETVRVFDRGFAWKRGTEEHKYSWEQVATFREGVRDLYLRGRPIYQRGAHVLKMRDGRVFKITGVHGDTRRFARIVRPLLADITGTKMGRALRDARSIRVHPTLTMLPNGVKVGKQSIPWEELDVAVKGQKLVIRRKNARGQFKTAKTYDTHQIDNLGGFMEVATMTIRNHQPERFNIKTQGPARYGR